MRVPVSRRRFLQASGALLAGAAGCRSVREDRRPLNVLFLMTDEQHRNSLSATGNAYVTTPNMDRIAGEGALFTNATCVTPYCSPSRASMITGLYPHTHRILLNVSPGRSAQEPLSPAAFPSTEVILHGLGYAVAHRGKWHLGDKGDFPCYESWAYASQKPGDYTAYLAERVPATDFADDREPGRYLGRPVRKIPAIRDGWREFNDLPGNGVGYIATIGRTVIPPEHLPETHITNQVLELLEKCRDRPFMITASWSPPHDLWVMPEPYYSMVPRDAVRLPGTRDLQPWDAKGRTKLLGDIIGDAGLREYAAIYHGMVKYVDDEIGRVLAKLDELGLRDNTLVLFTSDHGDMVGAHGCVGKSISGFYDDLVGIPLAMRLPGRIPAGTVVDKPVSQVDFMPTILDFLNVPLPRAVHGASLRPLIEGQDVPWRDYAFCQRADRMRMVRTERLKYFFCLRPRIIALYDLTADPHEDVNLAGEESRRETVRSMHARLLDIMRTDGDPLAASFPEDPFSETAGAAGAVPAGRPDGAPPDPSGDVTPSRV